MSILEIIEGKPSVALQFMVDGLLEQSKRIDFKIDMLSYAAIGSGTRICYGCAATCAIQKIVNKNLVPFEGIKNYTSRAEFYGVDDNELFDFEGAMDYARTGDLTPLFHFCMIRDPEKLTREPFLLGTNDWEEQLPLVRACIRRLQKQGH